MTIKEAILQSLQEMKGLVSHNEVLEHIKKKRYCDFGGSTPQATVSAQLGDFIRLGDSRVKRVKKQEGGGYLYYHSANDAEVDIELLVKETQPPIGKASRSKNGLGRRPDAIRSYEERDLHMLLSSFLKNSGIHAKTIYHEQSTAADGNQTWTHPDMVGIRFLRLNTKESQNLQKVVRRDDTFKITSYEIKREINTDSELKKAFFQAVSNSSWANQGFLVAFEISDSLHDEIERLNQSFGIGVIELNGNPYQSKVLFQARLRDLDFKTIDKLCKINKEFRSFIEQTEKLLTAEDRYYKAIEKELTEFCDGVLETEEAIAKYCRNKNIPVNEE